MVDGPAGALRRALISQQWGYGVATFPRGCDPVHVPLPPLITVESLTYADDQGVSQTVSTDDYLVNVESTPGYIYPAPGKSWPVTGHRHPYNVVVQYTCGYGVDWNAVPEPIRHALLLIVGELYKNRENTVIGTTIAEVPMASDALLAPYRVWGP